MKDVPTCCACRVAAAATERGSALPFRVWSAEERSSRIFLSASEKEQIPGIIGCLWSQTPPHNKEGGLRA